ncbi:MAG: AsmA family protein [Rhodobacterales bacterium]
MRWIVRIITVLVVLGVLAIGLVFMLPADKIGDLASAQLQKATGRTLTLSGTFKPTIYPVLGVKTGPLTISNASWASEPNMITASGASVGVGLAALIGGNLEIKRLVLDDPVIHLERRKDGVANWELAGATDAAGQDSGTSIGASGTSGFTLAKGTVRNGLVTYRDATSGKNITLKEINATIALPKSAAAVVNGSAVWNGRKAKVDLSVADLTKFMAGQVSNLAGSVYVGKMRASINGQAMMAPDAAPLLNGQYDFELPDMAALTKLTGTALPDALKGASNLSSKGTIMMSSAGLNLAGDAAVTMNGLPITAGFELTGPENWADTLRVNATLTLTGQNAFTFSWAGLVNGRTGNADGSIDFKASNLPATLKAAGQEIGFPKGTGKTARVKGVVKVRNGKNTLTKALFALDQNTFQGNAGLAFKKLPYITANLSAGALDFSAYASGDSGGAGASGAGASNSSGAWSKDPIRISGLDAIDADVALKAKSIDLGVSQLGRTDIKARLRSGALRLTLNEVRAYQGVITGVVGFSGGKAVTFSSDITAKGVQLEPLLGRLLDLRRLTGSGNTTLKLSGTGSSLYQIMHSLTGDGTLRIDKGSFKGIDLAAMMRNLKQAFGGFKGATEFTSLTGTFQMEKGVLQNVDMLMVSPLFKAEGKGQINVGEQNMRYTVTPSSLSKDAKFSVPVNISGPWSNLSFRPDMGGLINLLSKGRLGAEKAALKVKQDALKSKIEKQAKDKLGGLLKGLLK